MKPKWEFLIVVGIALFVTFHMVLLFAPIIPIEEKYLHELAVADFDGDGNLEIRWLWRPCAGGLSLADVDGDGKFELIMPSQDTLQDYLSTRTVYKSIIELLLGR